MDVSWGYLRHIFGISVSWAYLGDILGCLDDILGIVVPDGSVVV